MSYTMTLDMPQKATEYIERRGVRFQNEVNAIVLAFVTTQMQYEDVPTSTVVDASPSSSPKTGAEFVKRLRGDGPFLSDEEMHIFDRVKDYGREVDLV